MNPQTSTLRRDRRYGQGPDSLQVRIPADLETPVSAFLKLQGCGATFLLESVEQGIQVGRYSFIGIGRRADMTLRDGQVTLIRGGEETQLAVEAADPFAPVRSELAASQAVLGDDLPGPCGGAVGYVAYDMVRYFENIPLPKQAGLDLPDYRFQIPTTLAVFDHVRSEIEIVTMPDQVAGEATPQERIAAVLAALDQPLPHVPPATADSEVAAPEAGVTEEEFCKRVLQAKEHILAGDTFQVVLSQRLHGPTTVPPFQIYRALRIINPSPYLFFIDFGDFQTIGSSPEMLVKLDGDRVSLSPIAGTRPRGENAQQDRALEEELLADAKERAEHVMLVDLGRNDLGRVCTTGSVQPESLLAVERYSHVMHIVSRLTGTLQPDLDMFDLLRATFPAGTVTGAPKIRAMQIISELEHERRGPYAGAIGYFGRQGDLDMCIAIRTLFLQDGVYHAQAGAGIVADSDPQREYRETLDKVQALVSAVAIAEEGM